MVAFLGNKKATVNGLWKRKHVTGVENKFSNCFFILFTFVQWNAKCCFISRNAFELVKKNKTTSSPWEVIASVSTMFECKDENGNFKDDFVQSLRELSYININTDMRRRNIKYPYIQAISQSVKMILKFIEIQKTSKPQQFHFHQEFPANFLYVIQLGKKVWFFYNSHQDITKPSSTNSGHLKIH